MSARVDRPDEASAGAGDPLSDWHWSCDRILVATDGSDTSLAAVGWAARIAEEIPAELSVVYAYQTETASGVPSAAETSAARARLDRWCADRGAHGFGLRQTAAAGDPRSVLRDAIGWENPDLVVAGTRDGGGFPGLVLGSVAEWLTQIATYPVAVVPEGGQLRSGGPILVGIDGSPQSRVALDWAIGLAGRLRRGVHALHGAEWDADAGGRPGLDAVRGQIDRARPAAAALNVGLDLSVPSEHPVTALARRAEADDAEAVAVGARGHGQLGELTIGRVPRQRLRTATRPVIIIPR
jgi:nucleotide-binding universal stress UspA family protein